MEEYAADASSEAGIRFTLALLPAEGEEIGTGVCVSFDGNLFVTTARHLVKRRDPSEILFLRRPDAPAKFLDSIPEVLAPGQHLEYQFRLPIDRLLLSDSEDDLAALRLVGSPPELERQYFFEANEAGTGSEQGALVLVVGALRRLIRFGQRGNNQIGVASFFIESARVEVVENLPSDFDGPTLYNDSCGYRAS